MSNLLTELGHESKPPPSVQSFSVSVSDANDHCVRVHALASVPEAEGEAETSEDPFVPYEEAVAIPLPSFEISISTPSFPFSRPVTLSDSHFAQSASHPLHSPPSPSSSFPPSSPTVLSPTSFPLSPSFSMMSSCSSSVAPSPDPFRKSLQDLRLSPIKTSKKISPSPSLADHRGEGPDRMDVESVISHHPTSLMTNSTNVMTHHLSMPSHATQAEGRLAAPAAAGNARDAAGVDDDLDPVREITNAAVQESMDPDSEFPNPEWEFVDRSAVADLDSNGNRWVGSNRLPSTDGSSSNHVSSASAGAISCDGSMIAVDGKAKDTPKRNRRLFLASPPPQGGKEGGKEGGMEGSDMKKTGNEIQQTSKPKVDVSHSLNHPLSPTEVDMVVSPTLPTSPRVAWSIKSSVKRLLIGGGKDAISKAVVASENAEVGYEKSCPVVAKNDSCNDSCGLNDATEGLAKPVAPLSPSTPLPPPIPPNPPEQVSELVEDVVAVTTGFRAETVEQMTVEKGVEEGKEGEADASEREVDEEGGHEEEEKEEKEVEEKEEKEKEEEGKEEEEKEEEGKEEGERDKMEEGKGEENEGKPLEEDCIKEDCIKEDCKEEQYEEEKGKEEQRIEDERDGDQVGNQNPKAFLSASDSDVKNEFIFPFSTLPSISICTPSSNDLSSSLPSSSPNRGSAFVRLLHDTLLPCSVSVVIFLARGTAILVSFALAAAAELLSYILMHLRAKARRCALRHPNSDISHEDSDISHQNNDFSHNRTHSSHSLNRNSAASPNSGCVSDSNNQGTTAVHEPACSETTRNMMNNHQQHHRGEPQLPSHLDGLHSISNCAADFALDVLIMGLVLSKSTCLWFRRASLAFARLLDNSKSKSPEFDRSHSFENYLVTENSNPTGQISPHEVPSGSEREESVKRVNNEAETTPSSEETVTAIATLPFFVGIVAVVVSWRSGNGR